MLRHNRHFVQSHPTHIPDESRMNTLQVFYLSGWYMFECVFIWHATFPFGIYSYLKEATTPILGKSSCRWFCLFAQTKYNLYWQPKWWDFGLQFKRFDLVSTPFNRIPTRSMCDINYQNTHRSFPHQKYIICIPSAKWSALKIHILLRHIPSQYFGIRV